MAITPKNWSEFQHYKDRAPSWIKLHKALLDDYEFACLPLASRALAPCLWLLASEYDEGKITASLDAIAFRLRMSKVDLCEALHPLIESKFFSMDNDVPETEQLASNTLADCKHDACLEEEKRNKKEQERDRGRDARKGTRLHDDWRPSEDGKRLAVELLGSEDTASTEFYKFCDYWRGIPGQRGVKLDWDGTWRNWCRRAADDFKNRRGYNGKRHDEAGGNIIPAAKRLAEKLAEFDRPASAFGGADQVCGGSSPHPVRLLPEG